MSMHQEHRHSADRNISVPAIEPQDYVLTQSVKDTVERLLAEQPLPEIVVRILRTKQTGARCMPESEAEDRVLPDRRIVFMVSGGGAQTGILTVNTPAQPGQIPLTSPLGATLLGMRRLQKAPLPRESGESATLVALNISEA